jgi:hypothetical protein
MITVRDLFAKGATPFLLVLVLLVGAGNLWATNQYVSDYKQSQAQQEAKQQAAQDAQVALQKKQGLEIEQKLCLSFGRLSSLNPPSGSPSDKSRQYLEKQHDVLVSLGTDIGCKE